MGGDGGRKEGGAIERLSSGYRAEIQAYEAY